jgi:hypothetical protein
MQRSSRTTPRARAQAIGITLLAHAAALWLLVEAERRAPDEQVPELQYVSLWPDQRRELQQMPAVPSHVPRPASRAVQIQAAPPAPAATEQLSSTSSSGDTLSSQASIDWHAATTDAATRFAENTGGQQTFSPAPQPMRKSCKPRVFDTETKALMAERLPPPPDPDSVGPTPTANCIVVGGFPKCVQKLNFRRRRQLSLSGELLAQRAADKTPTPSVASPDVCD